ncbi:F510_1955 family glycosylhydrolase [Nonomuraea sp. NPDC048916]|uniref:F510_1955 family glycosylhydrolase n=1 Tax=Nonomuraea sp. NPDC048916 TaxID=3154232 RepID=UPI0033C4A169
MGEIHSRLRAAAAAAVLLLATAACGQTQAPASAGRQDPGIGHIHGLGVDPADGAIYVAGHYGLFRVRSDGAADRVADRIQDYMGFTVVGPRTFLASGHPAADSPGESPHLGLIRTTDSGRTWTTVSEEGVADFHTLHVAGDTIYAFDTQSGRLRRSADGGQSWIPGAEEPMIDLAVSTDDLTRVHATTPQGLKVSGDGGMEFKKVANAPLLTHIDYPAGDVLIGPDTNGQIHTSRDGGRTWEGGGKLPGPAAAFTAVDARRLLTATEDGAVLESRDGGESFTVIFTPAHD